MRIYEVAKKYAVSSKEIIDFLRGQGFSVSTHMAVLTDQEIAALESSFAPKQQQDKPQKVGVTNTQNDDRAQQAKKNSSTSEADQTVSSSKKQDSPVQKESVHEVKHTSSAAVHIAQENKKEDVSVVQAIEKNSLTLVPMTAFAFAEKTKLSLNDVIVQLLRWGIVTTKNQTLMDDVIMRLAEHFSIKVERVSKPIKETSSDKNVSVSSTHQGNDYQEKRSPVVVVIGHVDHGKTTLLDFIRKTRVAAKEKGGITQHIGAYEVPTSHGKIVFIDTPGHEAFIKIRQRGIRVADIAILVVAADDGVMPQTVEAIKQAKMMNLTTIVAINKVDKVAADRIEQVKRQLVQYELTPEDWGGDIVCVSVSAKTGKGVDQLLDMVSLQADMMELKTSSTVQPVGFVLETKVERGRGVVATVICHAGVLRLGDYFISGTVTGRIISMVDYLGKGLTTAAPTVPVQIAGFDGAPEIGEGFRCISKAEYTLIKDTSTSNVRATNVRLGLQEGSINIYIKTDTESSKEAIFDLITAINKKSKKQFGIVHAGLGALNESDVEIAYNSTAQIIVLHTRVDVKAAMLAHTRKVMVHQFDVIYKMGDFLRDWLASKSVETVLVRKKIGQAEVLRVFDIKGIGVIAGSIVRDGRFTKEGVVVALRQGKKVGEGKIVGLQRDRKTVKEVHTGFECGFMVEGLADWQVGDIAECYVNQSEIHKL